MADDDRQPPPPDLDVPATREAALLFRVRVSADVPVGQAWMEAASAFVLRHANWPSDLAEQEAVRTLGAFLKSGVLAPEGLEAVVAEGAGWRSLAARHGGLTTHDPRLR